MSEKKTKKNKRIQRCVTPLAFLDISSDLYNRMDWVRIRHPVSKLKDPEEVASPLLVIRPAASSTFFCRLVPPSDFWNNTKQQKKEAKQKEEMTKAKSGLTSI